MQVYVMQQLIFVKAGLTRPHFISQYIKYLEGSLWDPLDCVLLKPLTHTPLLQLQLHQTLFCCSVSSGLLSVILMEKLWLILLEKTILFR